MESPTKKCPGYINENYCNENIEIDFAWCKNCGKNLVKRQNKCKALERKYYSEEQIVPENLDFSKLFKIYTKLGYVLSLRRYINEYGYCPELRDEGHLTRIENIKSYRKLIKIEMQKVRTVPENTQIDLYEEEDELIEDIIYSKIVTTSEKPRSIKITDANEFSNIFMTKFFHVINSNLLNIVKDCQNLVETYIAPKLGKNFWNAFVLQYFNMLGFCGHTFNCVSKGKRATNFRGMNHSYFDREKTYLTKGRAWRIDVNDPQFIKFLAGETNSGIIYKLTKIDLYLNLYKQVQNLPLPKWIKKVIFNPTDKDIQNLTPTKNKAIKFTENSKLKREKKINLLRNKDENDYLYDLQLCMRTNLLGTEMIKCIISPTNDREIYKVTYSNIGKKLSQTDHIYGDINVSNYCCTDTFISIIVLDESILFTDAEILEEFKTKYKNYVEIMKSCCVLFLESRTRYLFTF
jgi:hypothetical protein